MLQKYDSPPPQARPRIRRGELGRLENTYLCTINLVMTHQFLELLKLLLPYTNTFIWQLLVFGTIFYFRKELRTILREIAEFKVGSVSVVRQKESKTAQEAPQEVVR